MDGRRGGEGGEAKRGGREGGFLEKKETEGRRKKEEEEEWDKKERKRRRSNNGEISLLQQRKKREDGGWRRRGRTNLLASVSTAKRTPPRFLASFDRGGQSLKKNLHLCESNVYSVSLSVIYYHFPPFSQTLTTSRSLTRTRATSPGPWAGCTPPQTSSLAEEEEKEIERGGGGVEFCTNQKGENTHV